MSLLDHLKFDPRSVENDVNKALALLNELGHHVANSAEMAGPDLTAGLRKLVEAKDCFLRAAVDVKDGFTQEGTSSDVSQ
jgi:hypothetical protein